MDFLLAYKINDYGLLTFFWNIFLALIPCLIVYRLSKGYHLKKWSNIAGSAKFSFVIIFLIWFFFFPNTAYLFTDIRHLIDYCDEPGYLRVCRDQAYIVPVFFSYALVGVPTFYYALSRMSYVLGKLFGKTLGTLFPIVMIPITSLGLMLGLVERFNSWDILKNPFIIVKSTLSHLVDPIMQVNILSYTLMMYGIYYFIKLTYKK